MCFSDIWIQGMKLHCPQLIPHLGEGGCIDFEVMDPERFKQLAQSCRALRDFEFLSG